MLSGTECVLNCPVGLEANDLLGMVCTNDKPLVTQNDNGGNNIQFKSNVSLSLSVWSINFWF